MKLIMYLIPRYFSAIAFVGMVMLVHSSLAALGSSPSNPQADPFDPVRQWWMSGKSLPSAGSDASRRMIDYYAKHLDDADVLYWMGVAQSKGIAQTNRTAFDLIQEAAEKGSASAQAQLGLTYLTGEAVQPNVARGLELIQTAYKAGNPDGALQLGRAYLYGTGMTLDLPTAEKYLSEALNKGHVRAHAMLADVYRRRGDLPKALEHARASADGGDDIGMTVLAEAYRDGKLGLKPDPSEALTWMRKAAERGNIPAKRELARMIFAGYGGLAHDGNNLAVAQKLLDSAVAANDTQAMLTKARLYVTADMGYAYEPNRAVQLLQKAADLNDPAAFYELGAMYVEGLVAPRDLPHARELMQKSADMGYAPAKQYLRRLTPALTTQPTSAQSMLTPENASASPHFSSIPVSAVS